MLRWTFVPFLVSLMLLWVSAPAVQALTISGVAATTNLGDSGFVSVSQNGSDSATSVTNAGGFSADNLGATVSAGTRYAQYAWGDADSGSTTLNTTSDYRVVMNITPDDPSTVYSLEIDTRRVGAIALLDDSFLWNGDGTASIGALTGSVDSVADANLAMGGLSMSSPPYLGGGSGDSASVGINQTGTTTIAGLSGNYSLVLDFVWTSMVYSYYDEASVRLGLSTSVSGVSVNDYPGIGSRTESLDGHFVDVTATVTSTAIPEPASALLLGLGLAGLALRASRG
jgi:hypothetical protein